MAADENGANPGVAPLPGITVGVPALRRDNPWPELPLDVDPFYLSLDGGGRHLITDVIREQDITLMVEIGCFLCGSTRQWLEASPTLTVIGVDPWDGNWSVHVRTRNAEGNRTMGTLSDPEETADTIQRHGNFRLALNNVRQYRDRFIPVRQRSPAALDYLHQRKIVPQLIYIDAAKDEDELWVAHQLFPDAILCGDDWNWRDDDRRCRMREHVERFVEAHGFSVDAEDATWIISKPPLVVPLWPPAARPLAWDAVDVEQLMSEIDALERDLLLRVATAARQGRQVSLSSLADDLGASRLAVFESINAINAVPMGTSRKQVLGLAEGSSGTAFGMRPIALADGLADLLH